MKNNRGAWAILAGVLALMVALLVVTLAHSISFASEMEGEWRLALSWALVSDICIFAFPLFRGFLQSREMGGGWLLVVLGGFLVLSLAANISTAIAGFYGTTLSQVFRLQVQDAWLEAMVPMVYGASIPLALLALSEAASKLVVALVALRLETGRDLLAADPIVELLDLTPGQQRKVQAVLRFYAGNPRARLNDLVDGQVIGSESAASRARKLALEAGALVQVGDMYRPTASELLEVQS